MKKTKRKKLDALNEKNFRDYAQQMINAYEAKNMLVDHMLWSQVIGYYERAIDAQTEIGK